MNNEKFEEIRNLLGDEFQALLDVYVSDTNERYKNIELAVDINDCDEIRNLAHAMKSSSANIGAENVSRLAASMEEFAGEGLLEEVARILPELQKAIDAAIQIMNN